MGWLSFWKKAARGLQIVCLAIAVIATVVAVAAPVLAPFVAPVVMIAGLLGGASVKIARRLDEFGDENGSWPKRSINQPPPSLPESDTPLDPGKPDSEDSAPFRAADSAIEEETLQQHAADSAIEEEALLQQHAANIERMQEEKAEFLRERDDLLQRMKRMRDKLRL